MFCPTCNILVEARVIARGFGQYRSDAVSSVDEADCEYFGDHYSVAICRRCNSPFLVREARFGVPGEFATVTNEVVLYPPACEPRIEGLPDSICRSVTQAHRSFATASYDACAVMCRRALEALCKSLAAKGRDLARQLADLEAQGRIDSRLLNWAHGVRLVGNEAAHDVDATVTAEDARDILEFTEALLMYVYTLDSKFRSFQSRRKSRAQKSSVGMAQPSAPPNGGPATPSANSGITEGPPSVS